MELKEILKSAIQALRMNALRSSLTMLGIIIGITAVILISSVGQGAVAFISNELSSFGTNFFSINPGHDMVSAMGGGGEPITLNDIEAIKDANIPNIDTIAPFFYTSRVVSANDETVRALVYGMTPEAQLLLKPNMIYGDFLAEDDKNNRVVILGSEVVEDLFGEDTDPVGESVKIDDIRFVVIGVSKSGGTLFGSFFNTAVNIPLETLQNQITGNDEIAEVDISVYNTDLLNETMDEVELVLRDHRGISDGEDADFVLTSFTAALDTFGTITTLLTVFIAGISAISLLVGGIGVMNIMLVSVTERTKEIGLLKAIGAKRKDILMQFLIESAVMTTIGGIVGIILGVGGTFLISIVAGIPFIISLFWILLAVSISTLVGVIFGIYPARKAADLQPIDALRYE
ncbi:ABC transporter permease [Patescibacteria group bacterium]|nr:ABC transporter permease [Patescibacteria group bacterium]